MNIELYLRRINYRSDRTPSTETLRKLQVAHLLTVPFENLSIHANEPIVLDDDALFRKIVEQRRGGFCYEDNGLFAALLRALGFEVTMLSAEVAKDGGGFSHPFDHMALMVQLEKRWLVDVGFGDSFLEPLDIDFAGEQVQGDQRFRIIRDGDYLVVERLYDTEWKPEYRFTLQSYQYSDYEEMCRFHQTSPESHFTRKRVCSLATPEGRITLSDMKLIVTTKGGREETDVSSDEEYKQILKERFGIRDPGLHAL